jgi:8-amino-7-oxononanoate synthase
MNPVWHDALQKLDHELKQKSLKRSLKVRSSPNQATIVINNKSLLSFSSNDYLGLSNHPKLQEALAYGACQYGVGSGASALITGHTDIHEELETELAKTQAKHIPNAGACFLNTGFMANIAMLSALCTLGEVSIYSDALNHASLIDGIRMAKASSKAKAFIYPHNDVEALEKLLHVDPNPLKLIVTDSVFSMDGDLADLPGLLHLANQYSSLLYVDDAHGFGVFGKNGFGSLEHFEINSPNLIYMGTLGKAIGVSGAFIAANLGFINLMIQKARPVIYSTSPSPAIAYTVLQSVKLMQSPDGVMRRSHLFDLIEHWKSHSRFEKWQCLPSPSAIQALIIGSNDEVLKLSKSLEDAGFWIPAIRPPTVPENSARLRIALNADHSVSQLDHLIATLFRLERI